MANENLSNLLLSKAMKTIGVLWWLWPETTAKFYLELINIFSQNKIKNRPSILIWNTALPLDLEKNFLLTGEWITEYLPYLIEGAKKLEKGWADFIVIPCNSVHVLIEQIRRTVSIPVISIIDETVNYLSGIWIQLIWLLSTTATSKYQLYELPLLQKSINIVKIDSILQANLDLVIYNIVNNISSQNNQQIIHEIVETMRGKQVKDILLACTDLQLICTNFYEFSLFDTMSILAKATAEYVITSI